MKIRVLALTAIISLSALSMMAQAPPPPPENAGSGGGPVGAPLAAPLDGGLTVFLVFAAAMAARQFKRTTNPDGV